MATAVYPGSVKTYTDKVNGVNIVDAADINSVQAEVTAIETGVGTSPATTTLGASVGSFTTTPAASLTARVSNLEAGLTSDITSTTFAGATDGSHVGYTLLYTGNYTSAPGALSISGASYAKIVVVVRITTIGSGTGVTLNVNNASTVKYGFFNYTTGVPTAGGGSTAGGSFPISNVLTPASGDTITAEIYNVNGTGAKTCTWVNGAGFGSAIATAGGTITSAVTTLTLQSSAYPSAATYAIYGVK